MSYGTADIGAMNDDMQSLSGRRYYKVKEGGEGVFLLPPWAAGIKTPWHRVMAHFNIVKGPVRCLKELNLPCDACHANDELYNMKDNPAAQELSKQIYAKPNFIYNIIPSVVLNNGMISFMSMDPKAQAAIVPYMASKTVQEQLMAFYQSSGNVFDPMNGCIFNFTSVKSGKFAKTFVSMMVNQRGRFSDQLLALIAQGLPDLSQEVAPASVEYMKMIVDAKLAGFRTGRILSQNPGYPQPQPQQPMYPAQQPVQQQFIPPPQQQFVPPAQPSFSPPPQQQFIPQATSVTATTLTPPMQQFAPPVTATPQVPVPQTQGTNAPPPPFDFSKMTPSNLDEFRKMIESQQKK